MKALRLIDRGRIELQEVDQPRPQDDEVVVRVERAGVCGTDLEILAGAFPSTPPVTMGHEYAGVVSDLGASVHNVQPGDRVVSTAAWGCGRCVECLSGRSTFCKSRLMLGSTTDGVFAEFVRVPARLLMPLPNDVDFDEGQSMIAVAVCLHGIRRVRKSYVQKVAVSGPGHVGLLLVQLLRRSFGGRVTLFGTRDERLTIGRQFGVEPVNIRNEDLHPMSNAFDVVFEAAGTPDSFMQALQIVAPGGTVCVLGVAKTPILGFTTEVLYEKEVEILGSRGGTGEYDAAIRALVEREVTVKPLISHRAPLQEAARALGTAQDRNQIPIRVVIEN